MSTTPQASAAPESTDDSTATTEAMTSLQETTSEPVPVPTPEASPEAETAEGEQTGGPESEEQERSDGEDTPGLSSRRSARTEDLVKEGEIAADFLEALLDIADLSGDLEVDIEGNRAAVSIVDSEDGAAPGRLVGTGGQVLEALQELARLAVQAETGERSRLMLDVAGYRADRRAQLVKTAQAAISEVQESGRRRELEPMTAFERKVVHDEVLAAGLHSESEGVEPSRFVVILPSA